MKDKIRKILTKLHKCPYPNDRCVTKALKKLTISEDRIIIAICKELCGSYAGTPTTEMDKIKRIATAIIKEIT